MEGFWGRLFEIEDNRRNGNDCCELECSHRNLLRGQAQVGILAEHVPLARRAIRAAGNGQVVVIVQQVNGDTDAAVGEQEQSQKD